MEAPSIFIVFYSSTEYVIEVTLLNANKIVRVACIIFLIDIDIMLYGFCFFTLGVGSNTGRTPTVPAEYGIRNGCTNFVLFFVFDQPTTNSRRRASAKEKCRWLRRPNPTSSSCPSTANARTSISSDRRNRRPWRPRRPPSSRPALLPGELWRRSSVARINRTLTSRKTRVFNRPTLFNVCFFLIAYHQIERRKNNGTPPRRTSYRESVYVIHA